jgi:hypothetical protein
MSQPTYIDQALTNVSNAWFNKANDLIAPFLFPEVLVGKKTFKVPRYGKENLRLESSLSTVRTGLTPAKRIDITRTYDDFGPLQEHALAGVVTKDDYELTDSPFEPEADTVEAINAKMLLVDEYDIANQLGDTSIITQNTTLTGTAQWNNKASADPFGDIETGLRLMDGAMARPNTLTMSWTVWTYLISNPNFLDRIKWTEIGIMTQEKFLQLMAPYGIEKLYVGRAKRLTSNEGQPDGSFSDVWGKNVILSYTTNQPGRKEINGAYKFRLTDGRSVTKEQKLNPVHTELVNTDYYDNVIMNASLFYLIKNVVA